jgi:hypothetical protein
VYLFLFTYAGMSVRYHGDGKDIEGQLTSTGGLSLYSRNLWGVFLQGALQPFTLGSLCGTFSTDRKIFTTRSIQNIPALLVVFYLLHPEDQQLLLDNARKFCDQLELSPLFVFGVSPDMLASIGLELPSIEPPALEFELPPPERRSNYTIINVPNDGNCGIAAVLCGLNPQTFSQGYPDILRLRQGAAGFVPQEDADLELIRLVQEQKARIAGWKKWLAIEDFHYIAQAIGRPILVITNVNGAWNYHRFALGRPGESAAILGGPSGAEAILDDNLNCLFVYHESKDGGDARRHFQAIVHN